MAGYADLHPAQIIRAVQLGDLPSIMADRFIWLCTGCQTCSTRCPQEIDVAGIMDELRMLAYEHDLVRKDVPFAGILKYNADSFKRWGRMYELELLARDKIMRPSSMTDDLVLGRQDDRQGQDRLLAEPRRRPRADEAHGRGGRAHRDSSGAPARLRPPAPPRAHCRRRPPTGGAS